MLIVALGQPGSGKSTMFDSIQRHIETMGRPYHVLHWSKDETVLYQEGFQHATIKDSMRSLRSTINSRERGGGGAIYIADLNLTEKALRLILEAFDRTGVRLNTVLCLYPDKSGDLLNHVSAVAVSQRSSKVPPRLRSTLQSDQQGIDIARRWTHDWARTPIQYFETLRCMCNEVDVGFMPFLYNTPTVFNATDDENFHVKVSELVGDLVHYRGDEYLDYRPVKERLGILMWELEVFIKNWFRIY